MWASVNSSSEIDPVKVLGAVPAAPVPIRIDTREQHPLRFDPAYAATVVATVKVFDYAVDGDDRWAIERKSVSDLIGSFTTNKDAELRKIEKARETFDPDWPLVYVVEGGMSEILKYNWNRFERITPQFFFALLSTIMRKERVHFIFAANRVESALWIYRLLKSRHKHLQEGSKQNVG